jgi:hypothetical protein
MQSIEDTELEVKDFNTKLDAKAKEVDTCDVEHMECNKKLHGLE